MSDQFENETTEVNAKDRGLFDCFGKKEENPKEKVDKAEEEKVYLNSSSSSSSEEEVEEDGVKIKRKKKKKGLTDKIKEKLPGHKDEAAAIPVSDYDNHHQPTTVTAEATHPEEKKGFLEMIKEKLPGHHKDDAVAAAPASAASQPPVVAHCGSDGQCGGSHEAQEKKGFLEKIKDKLPGGHKDSEEVKKDH
ncbi:dehydrin COR410-like [Chenopodium quinoa]|uniref:dehydrin COR410-like n=1 Tax=Chenopodium quinoa TaxID=63459 RepID=UPI000B777743|nr:dehydrin COR410-like [Chenopodium quinoa]